MAVGEFVLLFVVFVTHGLLFAAVGLYDIVFFVLVFLIELCFAFFKLCFFLLFHFLHFFLLFQLQ